MGRLVPSHMIAVRARVSVLGAALCALGACAPEAPLAPRSATVSAAVGSNAVATSLSATAQGKGLQDCAPDAKLIGRFAVSTADAPGT